MSEINGFFGGEPTDQQSGLDQPAAAPAADEVIDNEVEDPEIVELKKEIEALFVKLELKLDNAAQEIERIKTGNVAIEQMTGYKGKIKPEAAVALAEFTDIYRDKRESIDDAIDRAIADARIHATVANLYYRAIRPGGMYNALADAQDILRGIGMVRGPILEDINKLMELAAKLPDKYKQPAKLEVPEIE